MTTEELQAHGTRINVLNRRGALRRKVHSVKYSKMRETETVAKVDRVLHVPLGTVKMSVGFFHS